jgi:hypothetical protein
MCSPVFGNLTLNVCLAQTMPVSASNSTQPCWVPKPLGHVMANKGGNADDHCQCVCQISKCCKEISCRETDSKASQFRQCLPGCAAFRAAPPRGDNHCPGVQATSIADLTCLSNCLTAWETIPQTQGSLLIIRTPYLPLCDQKRCCGESCAQHLRSVKILWI